MPHIKLTLNTIYLLFESNTKFATDDRQGQPPADTQNI